MVTSLSCRQQSMIVSKDVFRRPHFICKRQHFRTAIYLQTVKPGTLKKKNLLRASLCQAGWELSHVNRYFWKIHRCKWNNLRLVTWNLCVCFWVLSFLAGVDRNASEWCFKERTYPTDCIPMKSSDNSEIVNISQWIFFFKSYDKKAWLYNFSFLFKKKECLPPPECIAWIAHSALAWRLLKVLKCQNTSKTCNLKKEEMHRLFLVKLLPRFPEL